jgi:hypothetical protein
VIFEEAMLATPGRMKKSNIIVRLFEKLEQEAAA